MLDTDKAAADTLAATRAHDPLDRIADALRTSEGSGYAFQLRRARTEGALTPPKEYDWPETEVELRHIRVILHELADSLRCLAARWGNQDAMYLTPERSAEMCRDAIAHVAARRAAETPQVAPTDQSVGENADVQA